MLAARAASGELIGAAAEGALPDGLGAQASRLADELAVLLERVERGRGQAGAEVGPPLRRSA